MQSQDKESYNEQEGKLPIRKAEIEAAVLKILANHPHLSADPTFKDLLSELQKFSADQNEEDPAIPLSDDTSSAFQSTLSYLIILSDIDKELAQKDHIYGALYGPAIDLRKISEEMLVAFLAHPAEEVVSFFKTLIQTKTAGGDYALTWILLLVLHREQQRQLANTADIHRGIFPQDLSCFVAPKPGYKSSTSYELVQHTLDLLFQAEGNGPVISSKLIQGLMQHAKSAYKLPGVQSNMGKGTVHALTLLNLDLEYKDPRLNRMSFIGLAHVLSCFASEGDIESLTDFLITLTDDKLTYSIGIEGTLLICFIASHWSTSEKKSFDDGPMKTIVNSLMMVNSSCVWLAKLLSLLKYALPELHNFFLAQVIKSKKDHLTFINAVIAENESYNNKNRYNSEDDTLMGDIWLWLKNLENPTSEDNALALSILNGINRERMLENALNRGNGALAEAILKETAEEDPSVLDTLLNQSDNYGVRHIDKIREQYPQIYQTVIDLMTKVAANTSRAQA